MAEIPPAFRPCSSAAALRSLTHSRLGLPQVRPTRLRHGRGWRELPPDTRLYPAKGELYGPGRPGTDLRSPNSHSHLALCRSFHSFLGRMTSQLRPATMQSSASSADSTVCLRTVVSCCTTIPHSNLDCWRIRHGHSRCYVTCD